MNVRQLKEILNLYSDDVKIMIRIDSRYIKQFDNENILLTSKTAYVDNEAYEDDWDTEGGKVELGDGERYLLFNPIIM